MIRFIIAKDEAGMTVKQYLKKRRQFSRRLLSRLTKEKNSILVNNKERRIDYRLKINDRLTITFPTEQIGARMKAEQISLNIVYEDEFLLIINKPPHIAAMPSFNYPTGTIANGILGYYEKENLPYTVHIVTRLDRNTSGLMVIAKHHYSHSLFSQMMQKDLLIRKYTAIVQGYMKTTLGTITAPISRAEDSIIKRKVHETGKRAITHYQVQQRTDHYSLVHIQLETGRTHQIRVHFSHIGHPLIGDDLYGKASKHIDRQALHCHEVQFNHPVTQEKMIFTANLPKDIQDLLINLKI